ncbi:amidohydrolase family protein [Cohnella soli]|uniref:Amidohydrolase family protein n=1 Tax=Cohnella soli TaxID=425005 RepID=A0ABW0I4W6_9BACL
MRFSEYAEEGLPLRDILVIDTHCHLGCSPNPFIPYADENEQLIHFQRSMNRVGVDYAAISMMRGLYTDELEANLDLAEMLKTNSNLLGWATYIPYLSDKSLRIAEQCLSASDRFIGLKVHPEVNDYRIDQEKYAPMWEFADERGLLVLAHAWGANSDPSLFAEIPARYRNMKLLLAHLGGVEPAITTSLQLANRYDNVYLDLTGSLISSRCTLKQFTERTDPDKLLFSSDMTFLGLYSEIGNVLYADIPDSVKERILGLNAKRLLKCIP